MQKLVFSLLLIAINAAMYSKVKNFDFLWDDMTHVVANPLLQKDKTGHLPDILKSTDDHVYSPISLLGLASQAKVSFARRAKLSPKIYHVTNLILHTLNCVLVFLILTMIIPSEFGAFLGALFFAAHPMQLEAFAYISAFKFVLGTSFGLLALWQYLLFAKKKAAQIRRTFPIRHYYVGTGFFVMAMLTLPSMIIVPFLAMISERLFPRSSSLIRPSNSVWPGVSWIVLGLPLAFFAITLQETSGISQMVPFWTRPLVAADTFTFYLFKVLTPWSIGPDYGRSPSFLMQNWWGYLTWIAPLTLTIVLLYWREKQRMWYASACALSLFALLPFLGFVAFEAQNSSTFANRFSYLAMLGPALAVGFTMTLKRMPGLKFLVILATMSLFYFSGNQLMSWKNENALWQHALKINPQSPIAHAMLANKFLKQKQFEKAKVHYQKVLKTNNTDFEVFYHLGQIALLEKDYGQATALLTQSLTLNPDSSATHKALGQTKLLMQEYAKAQEHLKIAASYGKVDGEVLKDLGHTMVLLGQNEEAIETLQKAVDSKGSPKGNAEQSLVWLAKAMYQVDRKPEAQMHLESALRLSDKNDEAHLLLANIFYEQGQLDLAGPHLIAAITSFDKDAQAHFRLGEIYLGEKNHEKAALHFSRALELEGEDTKVLLKLAIAQFYLKDFDQASDNFKIILKKDSKQADAHYYLGDIARWHGKIESAIPAYYRALQIEKYHAGSHYRLGNYFMTKKKYQQAVWHYNSALKDEPDNQTVIANLRKAKKALEAM